MKKLMFAAAAAFCGTVFGLESANVVGYQNKDLGENFNYTCPTFQAVSSGSMKLGDIGVNDSNIFISSKIEFLTSDGANAKVTDPAFGEVFESYVYWPAAYTTANVSGWYLVDDANAEYPKNDRVIAFGEGFCLTLAAGEEGAKLVYSGAVAQESTTKELGDNFNYLGNCSPVDITIGDLTVNDEIFISSMVEFLANNGANATVQDANFGEVYESYVYWPAEYTVANVAGWYLAADSNAEYPKNDRVIKAGEAFCVTHAAGEDGAMIVLPSAL